MGYIYAFIDPKGVPFYIGQTVNFSRRKRRHLAECKNGTQLPCYDKARSLMKKGLSWEIIIVEETDNLNERERAYIASLRSVGCKLMNMTDGGERDFKVSLETRKKLSVIRQGRKVTLNTRKKISESRKGMTFNEEHKRNLSKAWTYKNIPTEVRKRTKGKINTKKYILTDPQGNEYTTTNGLTLFCEERGLSHSNLLSVLQGNRTHHKGWTIRWPEKS